MNTFKRYFLVIALTTFFLGLFILLNYVFIIKNIKCSLDNGDPCPQPVVSVFSENLGTSLLTLDTSILDIKLKQIVPIRELNIEKKFPTDLNIKITLDVFQIPIKFLNQDITQVSVDNLPKSAETRNILLENGQIITVKDTLKTSIFINQSLNEDQLKQISFFLKEISSQSFQFNSLFAQNNTFYIQISDKTIIVPINHDPQVFISSLHSIQQDATIKTVKIIDFRYNHPILK
jgi:hypothetical protein